MNPEPIATDPITVDTVDTPIGVAWAASRDRAVVAAGIVDDAADVAGAVENRLRRPDGTDPDVESRSERSPVGDALAAYFAGDLTAIENLPVAPEGTDFQRRVWTALRDIPVGETRSYGELASAIGEPGAMRAVGSANGANPIWLIVPCHRVVRADGDLGGYAGGVERKAWLLAHELARIA